jgi:transcriptional regulator with XRE-family HTH domain
MERWREIRRQVPIDEARVETYKRLLDAEVRLDDLRRRRGITQIQLAKALEVSQPNVSRIEQEDDVYLSTLARYVAALGGHLELRAVFPEETVTLLRTPAPPGSNAPD